MYKNYIEKGNFPMNFPSEWKKMQCYTTKKHYFIYSN